ncbi:hypothetical protein [Thermococcus sp. JdF3]|uniref:hypothetical protein n=1 Tax=Thermococcus sp. JdF3 TaxID=1638258 RepID=UPI001F0F6EC9|nr:hypothetical protein [Thermococcus sp. JdF3]
MNRRMVGALILLLVLTLPGAAALSLPWSGLPVFGTSSGAYPIHLNGVEQSGNIAVVTWNVPPNCLTGYGTVLISKDGERITERVSLGRLKPWGKKVAVFLNVREPVYVKLRISSGNGIFMSSWVRLTPESTPRFFPTGYTVTYPAQKGEIRPQFFQAIGALIVIGLTVWDAYDTYKTCRDYGTDSMECKVQGTLFIVGVAVPGDEELKLVSKLGKKFGVTDDIYRILRKAKIINHADEVVERFTHIFDDIVKHGDDAAKALDDLTRAGVSTEAVEEAVKRGATIKGVKEGIERFAEKSSSFIVKNSGKEYTVVLEKGTEPERSGLLHAFLRHVWGYEMDIIKSRAKTKITTFWPLGQKIVDPKTGRVVQLPKVFRDEEGLREFLDEVLERALQKEEYYTEFRGQSFVKLRVNLNELGMHIDGIDVVEFQFSYNQAKGAYQLITAYPSKGKKVLGYVWDREKQSGRWIRMG